MKIEKTAGLFVVALFVCGVFLRLWMLGHAAFGADNMEFYKLALQNQNIIEFWKNPPWLNQIPLNETFTLLLIKVGLPATPFVVRLPFALMGIFALFFVWQFARKRAGAPAAALALLLAVFNPYQLYFSRTAYHYSGALCWSAALFCIFWSLKEKLDAGECPALRSIALWFATASLACHMHMSVWVVAGTQGALLLWIGWRGLRRNLIALKRFAIPMACGAILTGILLSPWIRRALQRVSEASSGGKQLLGADAASEFTRLLPAYFAGENIWAIALLAVFGTFVVVAMLLPSEKRSFIRSLTTIFLLHLGAVVGYIAIVGGGVAKISYFSAVWPMFILVLGLGAAQGICCLVKGKKVAVGVVVLGGLYLSLVLAPVWAVVNLDGKPTPYYKINSWADSNLPPGTPVLVDRWFEPWNELAIHAPSSVVYTFTVPDDPVESYRRFNWRATAEQFFEKYPQAAFLELSRGKNAPAWGGVWDFPRTNFSRRASITNNAAMILRKFKVFPTSGYAKANSNRVVTTIYYNKPDDLVALAHKQGRSVLRLYGKGWGVAKPSWQRGDFSEYRTFVRSATVVLYNLTDLPIVGNLSVDAATAGRPKTISMAGQTLVFSGGRLSRKQIPLMLEPGKKQVKLSSPSADALFVRELRWDQ